MAKARSKTRTDALQLRCFLSCDAVSHDQGGAKGKASLHGLFDAVFVDKFPGLFRPFFVFARLVGLKKGNVVTIQGHGVDGKPLGDPAEVPITKFTGKYQDIIANVGALPLTAYGTIRFDLCVDGKKLGWPCEITVERMKAPK